ncbi:DUF1336 domain-containing protein [Chloropicon primus]|uniref:DUF1336 domain-containing protein n=2 Tax=Chloropicon primus TaxID=1764295 RepID=A0A5B8MZD4_9CHLO|nr:DUF1336 domain-containing protein [Chloropicon primus]UPR03970.1 DUF1336 domain-containing protein [Chloropicon primus]|eukprot:QDZ24764.1 DUF1336 domain-containing protein [Chloropicon primus]
MATTMESVVYRWPPSTARSVLSTVGLARKISSVPVERFAVLRGSVLAYYHHEESYREEKPPARTWELVPHTKVSEVFPYNYGKGGWNPLGERTHSMCWCFTLSWPKKQSDNHHSLQIGFDSEEDAERWHDKIESVVSRLIDEAGLNTSMLKKVNREYTPQGTPTRESAAEEDGDEEVGTWYAVKHINGVRVFMESEEDALRAKEESARMISCVMRGDPQTVFESVWNFESYSHMKSNASFLKVVKQVDEHRRVIHVQFPYRGSGLLRRMMPTRVVLVEATWRQDCDGTFVILFSNHHQVNQYAKTTGGLVPARMNAAVTIAPLKPNFRLKNNYSHECLMTVVMRFEPGGWFETGSIPRIIINADSFFLQSMVDWFISIRERTEQERFVSKPLNIAVTSVAADSAGYKVEQIVKRVTSTAINTLLTSQRQKKEEPSKVTYEPSASGGLNSRLDHKFWSSAGADGLKVRGKNYLQDRVKIPAADPLFDLHRVDLFEFPSPTEHVAPCMDYIKDNPDQFFYVVQLMVPGPPHYSVVAAFTPKDKQECLHSDTPFSRLFRKFIDGTDEDRNDVYKLIPHIVEGSWIVQKAVGNTPAILGKKIRIAYHRGENYVELDHDIASSAMAANIVRLVAGATKTVCVDMCFLNEGHSEEELPEQLIGILRLNRLNLAAAQRVHMKLE